MNLQLDHGRARHTETHKSLWRDNRIWWINCLAIERFWFYGGQDLEAARGRRDALLTSIVEHW
jgi:hypothetical protein